jgi:hypothetical protein
MLRGGANPRSIRLRQVHYKAIVGGFKREQIRTRQPCSTGRSADFADGADFVALVVNIMRDGAARTDAMQDKVFVDDFAGQQRPAEIGAHAGQPSPRVTPRSARVAGGRPPGRRSPGSAGGCTRNLPRHGDFGDDCLAGEEQCLDDRTHAGGAACQLVRITNVLRYLGTLLRDRNPVRNGPADDRSC